jgi:hypothetical protein
MSKILLFLFTIVGFGLMGGSVYIYINGIGDNIIVDDKQQESNIEKDINENENDNDNDNDDNSDSDSEQFDDREDNSTDDSVKGYFEYDQSLIQYANSQNVILFFVIDDCENCNELDRDLNNNKNNFPDGLIIMRVPMEESSGASSEHLKLVFDLKITDPYTIIKIDKSIKKIKELTDVYTLQEIVDKL